jgi:exopolysaccharide production protein ExoZ
VSADPRDAETSRIPRVDAEPDTDRLRPVPRPRRDYLHGLDLLRVLASTVVVWAHLVGWFGSRGRSWGPVDFEERWVAQPLHLTAALLFDGVAVFMLISGVVVTQVADREGPATFLYRRLVRILPPMLVATTGIWILINLGFPLAESGQRTMNVGQLFGSFVFAGFFHDPTYIPLGVVWTLLVQIAFYVYVSATIPLLRRQPWLPPAAAVTVAVVVLSIFGGTPAVAGHQVGVLAAYLPVLCIGQLISLVRTGRVHPVAGAVIGVANLGVFVWADKLGFTFTGEGTVATLAVAVLAVIVLMPLRGPLFTSAVVRGWAARTYAIFLVHQAAMYPLLDALAPVLGNGAAVLVSLLAAAAAAEILYRLVEVPSVRWFRRRQKRRQEQREGPGRGPSANTVRPTTDR